MASDKLELDRPALTEKIGLPGAGMAAVTLLSASRGYGKTTLLRQWEQNLPPGQPLIHVSASGLQDPSQLWVRLALALRNANMGESSQGLRAGGIGAEPSAQEARDEVMGWVGDQAGPVVVILDDYQVVTNADVDSALVRMAALNPGAHLIVSGRRFATLDTPLLSSRIDSAGLYAEDLAFTADEVAHLLRMGNVKPDEDIAQIFRDLRGWPEATKVLIGSLQDSKTGQPDWDGLEAEFRDIFVDKKAWRVFGLVGLLPGVGVGFLQEATGLGVATLRSSLNDLMERGLIERSWTASAEAYRPRPGVMPPGLWRGRNQFTEEEKKSLRLSFAHEIAGTRPAAALKLLLEEGEYAQADQVCMDGFEALLSAPGDVVPLLQQIPQETLKDLPGILGLLLVLERALGASSPEQARERAGAMLAAVDRRTGGDLALMGLRLLAFRVAAERVLRMWDEAAKHAEYLELRLAEQYIAPGPGQFSGFPFMLALVSLTAISLGDYQMARRASNRALEIASEELNVSEQLRAMNRLSLIHAAQGDPKKAGAYLAKARALEDVAGGSAPNLSDTNAALAAAVVQLLNGEAAAAKKTLTEAEPVMALAEQWGLFIAVEGAVLRELEGGRKAFGRLRERILDYGLENLSPYLQANLVAQMADLAAQSGQLQVASSILDAPVDELPSVRNARARVALLQGRPLDAVRFARDTLVEFPQDRARPEALLLAALGHYLLGDQDSALQFLTEVRENLPADAQSILFASVPYAPLQALAVVAAKAGDTEVLDLVASVPPDRRIQTADALSPAELRTLQELGAGLSVKGAAEALGLSPNTVKTHSRAIYKKLGVSTREEMVQVANGLGLLAETETRPGGKR